MRHFFLSKQHFLYLSGTLGLFLLGGILMYNYNHYGYNPLRNMTFPCYRLYNPQEPALTRSERMIHTVGCMRFNREQCEYDIGKYAYTTFQRMAPTDSTVVSMTIVGGGGKGGWYHAHGYMQMQDTSIIPYYVIYKKPWLLLPRYFAVGVIIEGEDVLLYKDELPSDVHAFVLGKVQSNHHLPQ